MRNKITLLLLSLLMTLSLAAQKVVGTVVDAKTGEKLAFVNVLYAKGKGVQTDADGFFQVPYAVGSLRFTTVGYQSQVVKVGDQKKLRVKLKANEYAISEAVVRGKKKKYSRKNNPAVELMKKVIEAKKQHSLKGYDYYSIDKYTKTVFAFNEVTDKIFEEGKFKRLPFLKEHVEVCNETGKLILPISVDETVSRNIYRKNPETDKNIIMGQKSNGLNDFFSTGDIMTAMIKDCFTDVDIYDDVVRLLQHPFTSPISSRSAIGFYRYFLGDTLMVGDDRCIRVDFTPNNAQDFGFSGQLYILADSTYRVKKANIGIPVRSDVNFVDRMRVIQEFKSLPSGEQVLVHDDMIVELKLLEFVQKFQVKRTTEYSNFSFEPIADKTFDFKGYERTETDAHLRKDDFWAQHRSEQLSETESKMKQLNKQLRRVKGFKPILWVAKALIENHVETSTDPERPSKVDIGPVNTMITHNFVDGLRFRASAQTTANLHPQLFTKGYVAYGCKDHKWKGMGELTYSFHKKAFLPTEFPVNNLTFTYSRDVMSPSDKFMSTDKDNVFASFKWTTVDHMMYYERFRLLWDKEWANGLRFNMQLRTQEDQPTAALFYQSLNGAAAPGQNADFYRRKFRTNDLNVGISYQPGTTWINTKQRRIATNKDAPYYGISHDVGTYQHRNDHYIYNVTEAEIRKRFWMNSWGRIDVQLKGGIQWNRVPFPLLIAPAANLSYVKQRNSFGLMNNMEFLNDRYASLMMSWDMNGKIFNRIPIIRRLKWREYLACNVLWGTLSSKNNPFLEKNASNDRLYYFPGHFRADGTYEYLSGVMDPKKPYVEVAAGIHNIFKLLHVEYVRRLTYLDNPETDKWGLRVKLTFTF